MQFAAGKSGASGFSLIELMIASTVLVVGLLGGIGVICVATANNSRSRLNTTAATLAESIMERITAIPANTATTMTDCKGNTFVLNTAVGGSPLVNSGAFGGVQADFSQPPVPGYQMQYLVCTSSQGLPYDVRWTIDPGPTPSTQLVTVSAKALPGTTTPVAVFAKPVTLRTLRGSF